MISVIFLLACLVFVAILGYHSGRKPKKSTTSVLDYDLMIESKAEMRE